VSSRARSDPGRRFGWRLVATVVGAAGFVPLLAAGCSAGRSTEHQPDAPPPGLDQPSALATAAVVRAKPSPSPQQPASTQHWVNPNSAVCMESPNSAVPSVAGTGADGGSTVATGDAGTSPALGNISNAARVVAGMRARFRACYQALLDKRDPRAAGQVRLAFRVDCEGRIAAITAQTSGVDRETVDCMFAAVGDDRFDPPVGGKAVVNVPVNFAQGTKKGPTAASMPDAG
jgi:hypothetical protein